jgi:hypothetical protein
MSRILCLTDIVQAKQKTVPDFLRKFESALVAAGANSDKRARSLVAVMEVLISEIGFGVPAIHSAKDVSWVH